MAIAKTIYNLGIRAYLLGIKAASLYNPKAAKWLQGRKQQKETINEASLSRIQNGIWIHCASLGEFEQGRPLIEALKKKYPEIPVILTFFSPSGFEIRKNYSLADRIFYLPIDLPGKARQFVNAIKPRLAVFVKYEYWINHIEALKQQKVPLILVSGIFRKNQIFFRWYGKLFLKTLAQFDRLFVQNNESADLLKRYQVKNVEIAPDTRFDRVYAIAGNEKQIPEVASFCGNNPVLIAGSTWPADESLLAHHINQDKSDWKYIITPHEIDNAHVREIKNRLKVPVTTYTQYNSGAEYKVMILDTMGMLSAVYRYGSLAYVGGGFTKGIHNILEAAVYGLPVLFGPNYRKFNEAVELVHAGGGIVISNQENLNERLNTLKSDGKERENTGQKAMDYVHSHLGGTKQIMEYIGRYL
jgi:3-deoxy-D-manno-octulosonic-acid transferase